MDMRNDPGKLKRFTIEIPKGLWDRLSEAAEAQGIGLNAALLDAIAHYLDTFDSVMNMEPSFNVDEFIAELREEKSEAPTYKNPNQTPPAGKIIDMTSLRQRK
jgi:hypothetical protein